VATQQERRSNTRSAILTSARTCFLAFGYDHTSVSQILEVAGVSRGAMYHHFASKQDVFAAVFMQTSADAVRQAAARASAKQSPLDALIAGCLAWLEVVSEPAITSILLVDGPNALGWERCRSLEEATSLGVMRASITAAVENGEMTVPSIDTTARLLNAVLAEAALNQRTTDSRARADSAALIESMIRGLQ
jgi:AcrR family transcriptional regulator